MVELDTDSLRLVESFAQQYKEFKNSQDIFLLIPAYEEADNLIDFLPQKPANVLNKGVRVIIVDDGSKDATSTKAKELGAITLTLPQNRGGGYALKIGYAFVLALNLHFIVTLDADGQHQFVDLETLLGPLLQDEADLVLGSRRLGTTESKGLTRNLGIGVFNRLISFLVGHEVTDCSNSYRAFSGQALHKLTLVEERHHTAEFIIQAFAHRLRIVERPVHILERKHGESKKGPNLIYGWRFFRTILRAWRRARRV